MSSLCSYAQNFEDVMLWRALGHVEHGFYIDVGAHDPVVDSVSRAFYERGWRGVHVEPLPELAEALRRDRPDEDVVQAVLAQHPGIVSFHEIPGTGLSTLDAGIAERHVEAGYTARAVDVIAITMDTLLARYADREIHWLKLDVEGAEGAVLAGWTAPTPRPWIVVVESTSPMSQDDSAASWSAVLERKDYACAWFDGLNRFYVAREHAELMPALSTPPNVFDRFVLSGTASSTFTARIVAERDEARAAMQRLDALATELRAERDALGGDVSQVRAALDAERTRGMESERAARDFANRLVLAEQRVGALTRDLTDRTANLLYVQQALAAAERLAAERDAAYRGIEGSRSWRMTAPLRAVANGLRRLRGTVRDLVASPRSAARASLLHLLAHARADPRRRRRVARAVDRLGPLGQRLRRFASTHPPGANATTRSAVQGSAARAAPVVPTLDRALSPDATVEQQLGHWTERWRLGPRRNA